MTGEIILDDVHFAYQSRLESPVLKGVSLHIKAGSVVALVGARYVSVIHLPNYRATRLLVVRIITKLIVMC